MRRLTKGRRFAYFIAKPILKAFIRFIWLSCRVEPVIGEQHVDKLLQDGVPMIPCYWHQRHFFCTYYMLKLLHRGLKVGFLISPSVDGEVPARIIREWGAHVIRGSQTRAGAQAIRDLYQIIKIDGISPVNTPDGPTGPIFHFKPGTVMLAQLTKAPILPISFAAKHAWHLKTWDKFIIPKPFSRVQITVGEPQYIPAKLSTKELEEWRLKVEGAMLATDAAAQQGLTDVFG